MASLFLITVLLKNYNTTTGAHYHYRITLIVAAIISAAKIPVNVLRKKTSIVAMVTSVAKRPVGIKANTSRIGTMIFLYW